MPKMALVAALMALSGLAEASLETVELRGVRPDLMPMYLNDAVTFHCLDGSGKIPFNRVNDDYCDCNDGSDEPGTAACEFSKFYCANEGHMEMNLISSRVNDGICDCCDGSDEWAAEKPCANTCNELGRAAREERERLTKVIAQGMEIRKEMIGEGQITKQYKQAEASKFKDEIEALKKDLETREEEKNRLEGAEKILLDKHREAKEERDRLKEEADRAAEMDLAEAIFAETDANNDGKITVLEIMANSKFDQNDDGLVSEEEANFFLSGNAEWSKDDFKDLGWTIFKPHLDAKTEKSKKPAKDPELDGNSAEDIDDMDPTDDYEDSDYDEIQTADNPDGLEAPTPTPNEAVNEDVYDEETKTAVDAAELARAAYEEIRSKVRDLEDKIRKSEEFVNTDFGPESEFAPLKGQCFEYHDDQYVYKFCAFDSCTQKPKNGGGETRLGNWAHYEGDYSAMQFNNGAGCWNGPSRSTKVGLLCGVENKVTSVSEPSKCVYEMTFETPAACNEKLAARVTGKATAGHDEL